MAIPEYEQIARLARPTNPASSSTNLPVVEEADVATLHQAGWKDAQIAESIHVTGLFATFNRVANAFGLKSQGLLALYKEQEIVNETAR